MLNIQIIPCLKDNYAYLIHDQATAMTGIVDPSEATPVFEALAKSGLKLTHILNTHHHFDHTGGNLELKEKTGAKVVGPKSDADRIPGIDMGLGEGDMFDFGRAQAKILEIPAHTKGHIAFWFEADQAVFTGDTLFAMGCGRLFEGPAPQMWSSLSKLVKLPPETRVFFGHEYTQSNGRFALTLEPSNTALVSRMQQVNALRADGKPTIPSTIAEELKTNPFLRVASPEIRRTLDMPTASDAEVFAEVRRRKDVF